MASDDNPLAFIPTAELIFEIERRSHALVLGMRHSEDGDGQDQCTFIWRLSGYITERAGMLDMLQERTRMTLRSKAREMR